MSYHLSDIIWLPANQTFMGPILKSSKSVEATGLRSLFRMELFFHSPGYYKRIETQNGEGDISQYILMDVSLSTRCKNRDVLVGETNKGDLPLPASAQQPWTLLVVSHPSTHQS